MHCGSPNKLECLSVAWGGSITWPLRKPLNWIITLITIKRESWNLPQTSDHQIQQKMEIYERKYLTFHLTSAVILVWTKYHFVISEACGSPGALRCGSCWARGRVLPSPGGSLKYWVGNYLNIKYSRTLPAGRSSVISVSNLCIFPLKIEAQVGGQHSRLLWTCVCPSISRIYNTLVVVRWEQDPRALHQGIPAKPLVISSLGSPLRLHWILN